MSVMERGNIVCDTSMNSDGGVGRGGGRGGGEGGGAYVNVRSASFIVMSLDSVLVVFPLQDCINNILIL